MTAAVAKAEQVGVFRPFALMRHWHEAEHVPFATFVSDPADDRSGSFTSPSSIAARSSMSAPPPTATDFCARHGATRRAKALNRYGDSPLKRAARQAR